MKSIDTYNFTMATELFIQALTKFLVGLLLVALLLFIPAGTFAFWQAYLLIGILFAPMFIVGIWLMSNSPELLRKRLSAKEEQTEQKWVVAISGLLFIAMFVVAGLNFRFGWLLLPDWTTFVAAGFFLLGYALYAEVMRENLWLSRTVEVQQDQKVIDTELYGIVRHPMYSATLVLFLSMPLVLNSVWSFVLMLLYVPIIVKRIRNEEDVLERDLAGYKEYKQCVRYRLIPYIW
jgi:protein-S-isoprenylcysteine O-methyltransferase Ste14